LALANAGYVATSNAEVHYLELLTVLDPLVVDHFRKAYQRTSKAYYKDRLEFGIAILKYNMQENTTRQWWMIGTVSLIAILAIGILAQRHRMLS